MSTVKHVQKFFYPDEDTHFLEIHIRQFSRSRKRRGYFIVTATIFPHPRQGTECLHFSKEIKKEDFGAEEKKRICSTQVDPTTRYQRVGSLFAIKQASTGILISFRGEVFALWDGQQFRSL